jgi:hypothetical protein
VALARQVEGRNQADRPCPDDHYGMVRRRGPPLIGRSPVLEHDLAHIHVGIDRTCPQTVKLALAMGIP